MYTHYSNWDSFEMRISQLVIPSLFAMGFLLFGNENDAVQPKTGLRNELDAAVLCALV